MIWLGLTWGQSAAEESSRQAGPYGDALSDAPRRRHLGLFDPSRQYLCRETACSDRYDLQSSRTYRSLPKSHIENALHVSLDPKRPRLFLSGLNLTAQAHTSLKNGILIYCVRSA